MRYKDYIKSDRWREVAEAKKQSVGNKCEICNSSKRLQVHHRTYERLGNENENDLTVLCWYCHAKFHNKLPKRFRKKPKREVVPPDLDEIFRNRLPILREAGIEFFIDGDKVTSTPKLDEILDRRLRFFAELFVFYPKISIGILKDF